MNCPLISIITVVYNASLTLETTILSVLAQERSLFEYWIIDGGSTDTSLDIIRKYEDRLTGWLSEPDGGIYDAMNKGIDRAKGKWLYFLGADDQLRADVVKNVAPYLDSKYAIVFGSVSFDTGHTIQSYLNRVTLFQNTLHHQSAFYSYTLFRDFRYNTTLRTIADFELNLLAYTRKLPVCAIPVEIALCQSTGASSDWALTVEETNIVRRQYVKPSYLQPILSGLLHLYYAQKRIRRWLNTNYLR